MSSLGRFRHLLSSGHAARGQRGLSSVAASQQLHLETPLIHSEVMSAHLGAEVYLKMDCLQPPGSFKIRGIGETVRQAVLSGASRIVSSSGGNAGLAAAYAAKRFGIPLTVVLPTTTPQKVHSMLNRSGAEVVVHGDVWDQANAHALHLTEDANTAYIHPFGQATTWQGHATVVAEIARQLPGGAPDAIVTCVGGGGLLMGILQGVEACGWSGATRVVACETEGAASMAGSLAKGELITLPSIASVAKSLGAQTVGKEIFEHCFGLGPDRLRTFVMTDREAVSACVRLAAEHRVLVEPACGAALSAVYERSEALQGCSRVVVEVCGGALVDLETLNAWARETGVV